MSGPYAIGETVWVNGVALTIAGEPYMLYGGEFQDATTRDGRTKAVATLRQFRVDAERVRREHSDLQAGFRRLKGVTP